jgi:hypothetical protein
MGVSGSRRLRVGCAATLALVAAASTVHPEFETDPSWRIVLGRNVLRHRSRGVPEPLAFESFSAPNVVQEWL